MRYAIPLIIFLLLVGLFIFGLQNDPKKLPSKRIGKPAPEFTLPELYNPETHISPADLKGKVWVLNVFASWCVSCRAEHEVVTHFTKTHNIDVVGLNYKDEEKDAKAWLKQFGNPYSHIAVDYKGYTGIDWGVYGVPETFVIDKKGLIRHRFAGPLTEQIVATDLLPLVQELQTESGS